MTEYRIEKDSLGEKQVPADAYYGIQSLRACENFPISRHKAHPVLVWAIVQIKRAAARVHESLGLLDKERTDAIVTAADEVLSGKFDKHFIVDVYQAGAGTSQNMNANEVLAARANEILGIPLTQREGRRIHPNDDVNKSQSTNDVIPCAIRIAALKLIPEFEKSLRALIEGLRLKAKEFDSIVKSGRTHLQDAVPVRLGQEFGGYADALQSFVPRLEMAKKDIGRLGIGGSAAGTGMNVHPAYRKAMVEEIGKTTGFAVSQAPDYFSAMQSNHDAVFLSNVIAGIAIEVSRIASDLRLLASGPRTGFAEILLPAVQPGSSIMPGKVNPSIAEMVNQVCFQIMGYNTAINYAAQAGQLELNVMMPLMANDLIEMLEILGNAMAVLDSKCIRGIKADAERCKWYAENSLSMVTALNTFIGYDKAAEVAKEAVAKNKGLREVVLEKKLLTAAELDKAFDLIPLTETGDTEKVAFDPTMGAVCPIGLMGFIRRLARQKQFLLAACAAGTVSILGAEAGHSGDAVANVLLVLLLMLLLAKLGGDLLERIGQPAVLGELIFGMLLGNLAFFHLPGLSGLVDRIVHDAHVAPFVEILAEIGVILLLFEVGLESTVGEMLSVGISSLIVAVLGIIAPMGLGFLVGHWFLPTEPWTVHLFIGAVLAATSVGITARVLTDLKKMHLRESKIILGAAVIDDILGLVVLAVVQGMVLATNTGIALQPTAIAWIASKAILFFVVAIAAGMIISPRLYHWATLLNVKGVLLTLTLGWCFLVSYLGYKLVGLAPIVGAFAGGLVLEEATFKDWKGRDAPLKDLLRPITTFLVPIFFVYMGMKVQLSAFTQPGILGFASALTFVAIIGKQLCSFGVVERGLNRVAIGIGMVPRGEVGLIVANIGLTMRTAEGHSVISSDTFSATVIMVVLTTIVTPPALKWALEKKPA